MMWGSAADNRYAYFPVTRSDPRLGLAALDLATGNIAWRAAPPEGGGAPIAVIPGAVFFGSSSGVLFAYGASDGRAIWQFDTARRFDTVNGVEAKGGNINAAGPVVAGGRVFVTSGYSDLGGGVRGNVLLALAPR
jgi:polyvinyl alcohol dehydrogenase (cytochrome)